jgi:hypothetical protein
VREDDSSVMIVRSYAKSTVTWVGLQIDLWYVKGTVAYCSDVLNGNWNLDTDCRSIISHIALILTPAELSISWFTKCRLNFDLGNRSWEICFVSFSILRECTVQLDTICGGAVYTSIIKADIISTT